MKYEYLIIDATNLFWRAFAISLKKFIVVDGHEIVPGAISEGIKKILKIKNKFAYKDSPIFLLFDNPESALRVRKIIDKDYKSIRLKKCAPKGLYPTMNFFIYFLRYYSDTFKIVSTDGYEADDLTKPLIQTLELNKIRKALCISNDLDWSRNISEYVDWWNWGEVFTINKFKKKYGFSPENQKVQIYKAIHGDKSDSIKNAVKYLPKEILIDIVNKYECINDLFKNISREGYPDKWKQKILESEHQIRINYKLANFANLDKEISKIISNCKRNSKMLETLSKILKIKYKDIK